MKNDCILELDYETAVHLSNYLKTIYATKKEPCIYCLKIMNELQKYFKTHSRNKVYENMKIKIDLAKKWRDLHV